MANLIDRALLAVSSFGERFFSQKSGVKDYNFQPDGLLFDDSLGSSRLESSGAFRLYRQSSAVATAVDMIADKIEDLNPVIQDRNGRKVDQGSEVLDLLASPNGFQTYREFIGDVARNWLLSGNFYTFNGGSISRLPVFLFSVHPSHVTPIVTSTDNFPESFSVSSGHGEDGIGSIGKFDRVIMPDGIVRYIESPLREISQVRAYSSRSRNMMGDSPLEPVLLEIRQHIQGSLHNASLLEKGARPSAVFAFKDRLTGDQYKERVKQINDAFGGAKKAGRIAVLSESDLEIIMMGMTNVDMDFANLNAAAREAVFTHYKIPSPLVSKDRQTFSNYETAILSLYDDAVCPTADRIFEGMSRILLPRAGIDHRQFMITYDQTDIPALRKRVLDELKLRKETGIETPNELRELMNDREPVEGGDKVYQPATLVALGTDPLAAQEDEEDPDDEARRIAGPND